MIPRIPLLATLAMIPLLSPGPASAQDAGLAQAPPAARAASEIATSQARLRRAENLAETQRRITDRRVQRRDRALGRSLRSICKGC